MRLAFVDLAVKLDEYDRSPELSQRKQKLFVPINEAGKWCSSFGAARKLRPPTADEAARDVCAHIELQRKYWANLKAIMVRDVAARGRSYWGWTEEEWIESIRKGGHEKPSVAAVGYLLCGFDALHKLGGKSFIFYGLAYRIFGREHVRSCSRISKRCCELWISRPNRENLRSSGDVRGSGYES